MKKFKGYMLVSDFDGPLINKAGKISQENIEAIEHFVQNGGLFCGATGRTQLNITPFKDLLPIVAPWILYNGGGIYDFEAERFLYKEEISKGDLMPIAKMVMAEIPHINVQVCTTEMLYLVNPNGLPDAMIVEEGQIHESCQIEAIESPWIKLMFQGGAEDLAKVETILDKRVNQDYYRFFYSGTSYLEIMGKSVSKGSGLHILKDIVGDTVEYFCAIGDYFNDVEMLQEADISATPNNAPEAIKEHARIVVNHHDDHAVKDFIVWIEEKLEADKLEALIMKGVEPVLEEEVV